MATCRVASARLALVLPRKNSVVAAITTMISMPATMTSISVNPASGSRRNSRSNRFIAGPFAPAGGRSAGGTDIDVHVDGHRVSGGRIRCQVRFPDEDGARPDRLELDQEAVDAFERSADGHRHRDLGPRLAGGGHLLARVDAHAGDADAGDLVAAHLEVAQQVRHRR